MPTILLLPFFLLFCEFCIRSHNYFIIAAVWGVVAGIAAMYACAPYNLITNIPIIGGYYKDEKTDYTLNDEPIYDGYEVVIIDEAHNFRNPETQKYKILAPYLNGKKVVLLTATPQNKSVWDIYRGQSISAL